MSSMGHTSNDRDHSGVAYAAWAIAITGLEWFVFPGLGVLLGVTLAMTRYRTAGRFRRWILAALGLVVLALHIVGTFAVSGGTTLHTGP